MTVGYAFSIAALGLLVWLGNGVRRIGKVSTGNMIPERPGSALLLVDLQSVFWENGPYSDTDKRSAAGVILREAQAATAQDFPVIAVRQEWSIPSTKALARISMKGQAIKGSAGTELAELFAPLPDHVIVKRVQDAFETGELDTLLAHLNVGKLRLVGLDFNFCVQKTALAARKRGFDVTVVTDGTLAAASTEASSKRMSSAGVVLA